MQIVALLFSNKDLNFDFLSKFDEFKIIVISSIFFSIISLIISLILSLALEIIISFFSSNNDFVNIVL